MQAQHSMVRFVVRASVHNFSVRGAGRRPRAPRAYSWHAVVEATGKAAGLLARRPTPLAPGADAAIARVLD